MLRIVQEFNLGWFSRDRRPEPSRHRRFDSFGEICLCAARILECGSGLCHRIRQGDLAGTVGEVPIVQAKFALGIGVGPAGALFMTLPAVSLPSLAMLGRVFSLRTRIVITTGVALSGIVAGLIAMIVF